VSIDTERRLAPTHAVGMIDLVHRLRRIAQMAGDDRRNDLERALRADARAGRALLEQRNARDIADALMRLCDALGFESLAHAQRLVAWCRLLGDAAGLEAHELDSLALGARVHDVGKLGVAAAVLGAADALTATELDWIRMHGSLGHALLAGVAGLEGARELVLCHHEYWDGSGYPEGRCGTQTPRAARVFVLVDSYEAITRDDVAYRACRDDAAARAELIELAGVRYDPELVAIWRAIDARRWQAAADAAIVAPWAA
jgi:response regulator RpfG family c-di-GMP phosphodiesterase